MAHRYLHFSTLTPYRPERRIYIMQLHAGHGQTRDKERAGHWPGNAPGLFHCSNRNNRDDAEPA